MSNWFYELPVVWMAVVVFTVTYLATAAIWWSVMSLASRNRAARYQRIAAGLLSPLGITFGLLVGFLSVQVWNDSQRAREAVIREAGALRTAVILASNLPAPARTQIYALIARGAFPKPIALTKFRVGWIDAEITAWIAARVAEFENRFESHAGVPVKAIAQHRSRAMKAGLHEVF